MTRVFAVNSGCYSDYRINGIFSTRAKAQEFMDKCKASEACWNKDFNDIEVYDLDEELEQREYTRHTVGIFVESGKVEPREQHSSQYFGIPENKVTQISKIPCYDMRLMIRAESSKSMKHAVKLAVEARQAYLRKKTESGN